jgi:hypothetical protein
MNEGIPKQEKESNLELTQEEKRNLGVAWVGMITDGDISVPENIEDLSKEELKDWLFSSVMEDVESFIEENNIQVGKSIITGLLEETDDSNRAEIELRYIEEIKKKMAEFSEKFRSRDEDTKWNSCPSLMKETKSYNCVGGTLIGMNFLEKAGIRSFYGCPVGHAVNIIELSDGRLVYADFTNQTVKEIEREEIEIEGVTTLKINELSIEYGFVSVHEPQEIVASVMNNIASMQNSKSLKSIKTSRDFVDRNTGHYENVDFGRVSEKLFPDSEAVGNSKEMIEDRKRIDTNRELRKPLEDYRRKLSVEDKKTLSAELRVSKEIIRAIILDESLSISISEDVSDKLKEYFKVLISILKEEQTKSSEGYENAKSYFMSLLDSM